MNSVTADSTAVMRIAALLDEGSFVEIGGAITARSTDFNLQNAPTPGDGVLTGYGLIDGNLVYVYCQNPEVLHGTIGEMHAKKIANVYDMAMKMGAPVIGLIDCAGMRLQEATDALYGFGNLYLKQTMASGVIPQITAVFGACGGGLSVAAGLSDFTFMEAEKAKLFVNSPNAIPGNCESKCDTASAEYQSSQSGLVDGTGSEAEILGKIRELICMLPANNEDESPYAECADDLNRICADLAGTVADTGLLLAKIADQQYFLELKEDYAKDMVTGFLHLNGQTVGAVANRSVIYDVEGNAENVSDGGLSVEGAEKAARLVEFCDAFHIPVLTVTNVNGFKASEESERRLAKASARLVYTFANATVPKVNVIAGKAFGSAGVVMNSKSVGADMVYAWPDAEIGMMDAELAAKIMYADETAQVQREKAEEYKNLQSSPVSAARRGYVDTLIQPENTRKYVIGAFEMLATKREERPFKKHGTV